ncbi:ras-related protein rab11 [Anaeramoeba flamelloides]|uniref:Ras-related protein rab11 n=1 Tax=Anaeramoeba flamelloides TaxID=1746091 RepID=A0ABQ8XHJ1_9EUKA|nr:ras-related protein rab11 [Anaeramoeba flamelloides]
MSNRKSFYKLVLIGDSGVGKTNLLTRFCRNEFNIGSKMTIGVEFASKTMEIENTTLKAQVWDTAGQEKYRAITNTFYRGAKGALLVYSVTERQSFINLKNWLTELRENSPKDITVMLIGNKIDLADNREVLTHEGTNFAEENNLNFIETSAKDATNVEYAFLSILTDIFEKDKKKEIISTENVKTVSSSGQIRLEENVILKNEQEKKSGCC